jgi:competence protein ComEC
MNRRLKILTILTISITLLVAAVYLRVSHEEGKSEFVMLDVGQGDSFLIQTISGKQILIDGGRQSKALGELASVLPQGDTMIDIVIATHPDADHIGGLPYIVTKYKIGLFLTTQATANSEVFKLLQSELFKKKIPSYYVRSGMKIKLDEDITFEILFPDRDTTTWETNTASIVGRITSKKTSALFMGDAPQSVELYLVKKYKEYLKTDILKIGHHGSKTSTAQIFLEAVDPDLALISAGKGNRYGHPNQEVLTSLGKLKIKWISTAEKGTVRFPL